MMQLVMTELIYIIHFSLSGEAGIFFFVISKAIIVHSHCGEPSGDYHLLNTVAALNGQLENSAGSVLCK